MKNINKIVLAVAALACLSSCGENKTYWQPAELAQQENYSFTNKSMSFVFMPEEDMKEVVIPITRTATSAAATLPLTVNTESEMFSFPSEVSFAAGSAKADLVVSIKDAFEMGQAEYFGVQFDKELASASGVDSTGVKVMLDYSWTLLGTGSMADGFFVGDMYDADFYQADQEPSIFKVTNPFKAILDDAGETFSSNADEFFQFRVLKKGDVAYGVEMEEDDHITYGAFNTGWDHDGDMYWMSAPYFRDMRGGTSTTAHFQYDYVETWQENGLPGIVQFSPYFLTLAFYGYGYDQLPGVFYWVFPGYEILDYSVKVTYTGRTIDTDEREWANATIKLGADVAYAQVALVEGAMSNDVLGAVLGGAVECQTIEEGGDVAFEMVDPAPGKYTIVAISFDENDEAADYGYKTFVYTAHGAVVPDENPFVIDGHYAVAFTYGEKEYPWSADCEIASVETWNDGYEDWNCDVFNFSAAWDEEGAFITGEDGVPAFYDETAHEFRLATMYDVATLIVSEEDAAGYKVPAGTELGVMFYIYGGANSGADYVTFDVDSEGNMVEQTPGELQAFVYSGNSLLAYFPAQISSTVFAPLSAAAAPAKVKGVSVEMMGSPIMLDEPISLKGTKAEKKNFKLHSLPEMSWID